MQRIRPATPKDFVAVEDIYRRAIQSADWLPVGAKYDSNFSKSIEGEQIYVCDDQDGKIIGFISVWKEDYFIHHLYVDSESQGKGVGTKLVKSLRRWLQLPWSLKCVLENTKAMGFYLSHGFVSISEHKNENPPYALLRKSED
jgi:ribosomal protein S18 acetylase RimI-like enzyme